MNQIASSFDRELVPRRRLCLDTIVLSENPSRGDLEARIKALVAEAVIDSDPDRYRAFWKASLHAMHEIAGWSEPEVPLRSVSLKPLDSAVHRRAVRLLAMVHELHKAGYQRIRISPGMSPSGMYWRCLITYAANIDSDGFSIIDWPNENNRKVAPYSSGSESEYFGWKDASKMSARNLAAVFVERFPEICREGQGRDWAYSGWLTDVLGAAEQGRFTVLYADYPLNPSELALWLPPSPPSS